jgi:YHS domain-containing protein
MIRTFIYILAALFLIIFVRAAAGIIGKAIGQLFEPEPEAGRQTPRIELKKDPVCGIYVSADTKVRKTIGGKEYYFCSESCRDRFKG